MASSRPTSSASKKEEGTFAKALKTKMNRLALRKVFKNYGKKGKDDLDAYKMLKGLQGSGADKASIPKVSEELNTKTVFEVIKAELRPAEVKEKPVQLKWKEGFKPADEATDGDAAPDFGFEGATPEMLAKNKDFVVGSRIMMEIRQHNMLEDVLGYEGNMAMRRFFEEGFEKPNQQILDLLHRAMDLCYNRIVFYNDDYNMVVDSEMRTFLVDKDRAKLILLDVMMMVPDFIPLNWGGKAIGMMLCDDPEAMNHVVATVVVKKQGVASTLTGAATTNTGLVPAKVTGPLAVPTTPEEGKKEEEKEGEKKESDKNVEKEKKGEDEKKKEKKGEEEKKKEKKNEDEKKKEGGDVKKEETTNKKEEEKKESDPKKEKKKVEEKKENKKTDEKKKDKEEEKSADVVSNPKTAETSKDKTGAAKNSQVDMKTCSDIVPKKKAKAKSPEKEKKAKVADGKDLISKQKKSRERSEDGGEAPKKKKDQLKSVEDEPGSKEKTKRKKQVQVKSTDGGTAKARPKKEVPKGVKIADKKPIKRP